MAVRKRQKNWTQPDLEEALNVVPLFEFQGPANVSGRADDFTWVLDTDRKGRHGPNLANLGRERRTIGF